MAKDCEACGNPIECVCNHYTHYCPEWDYMEIKEGDPEMDACLCHGFDKELKEKNLICPHCKCKKVSPHSMIVTCKCL